MRDLEGPGSAIVFAGARRKRRKRGEARGAGAARGEVRTDGCVKTRRSPR